MALAGIQFRALAKSVPITNFSGGTCAVPTGTQSGDLMLAHVVHGQYNDIPTTPSGWTLIASRAVGPNGGNWNGIYAKVAGGSEPPNYTWLWASVNSSQIEIISLYDASGGTLSVDASECAATLGVDNVTPASLTASTTNEVAVVFMNQTGGASSTNVDLPPGYIALDNYEWADATIGGTGLETTAIAMARVATAGPYAFPAFYAHFNFYDWYYETCLVKSTSPHSQTAPNYQMRGADYNVVQEGGYGGTNLNPINNPSQPGDLLVAIAFASGATDNEGTPPSGDGGAAWTRVGRIGSTTGPMTLWKKIANSSEPASYTWDNFTIGSMCALCIASFYAPGGGSLDVLGLEGNQGNATNAVGWQPPSINPATANDLVWGLIFCDNGNGWEQTIAIGPAYNTLATGNTNKTLSGGEGGHQGNATVQGGCVTAPAGTTSGFIPPAVAGIRISGNTLDFWGATIDIGPAVTTVSVSGIIATPSAPTITGSLPSHTSFVARSVVTTHSNASCVVVANLRPTNLGTLPQGSVFSRLLLYVPDYFDKQPYPAAGITILYAGAAAKVTIANHVLSTSVIPSLPGQGGNLTFDLTQCSSLTALVAAINAVSGYTAKVAPGASGSPLNLMEVSNIDITGLLSAPFTVTTSYLWKLLMVWAWELEDMIENALAGLAEMEVPTNAP